VKKALLLIFCSLALVGCSSLQASGDRNNLEYVHDGMTRDQVVEIMRAPNACAHFGEEEVMVWNGASISLSGNQVTDKTKLSNKMGSTLEFMIDHHDPRAEALVDECFSDARSPASVNAP